MIKNCILFMFSLLLLNTALAQPKKSMCDSAVPPYDYDTIGDCYWYGVVYEQDKEKAKVFYLYAAMQSNSEAGEYGKLSAIRTLTFESNSPVERAMGLYLAKEFADSENIIKVEKPKYEGHYTRRGSARYMLSAYFVQKSMFDEAEFYLKKALDDNHALSAYALLYLNEAKKLSSLIRADEAQKLLEEGNRKQEEFFYWHERKGYSCWLQSQIDGTAKHISFPVEQELVKHLLEQHGPCK